MIYYSIFTNSDLLLVENCLECCVQEIVPRDSDEVSKLILDMNNMYNTMNKHLRHQKHNSECQKLIDELANQQLDINTIVARMNSGWKPTKNIINISPLENFVFFLYSCLTRYGKKSNIIIAEVEVKGEPVLHNKLFHLNSDLFVGVITRPFDVNFVKSLINRGLEIKSENNIAYCLMNCAIISESIDIIDYLVQVYSMDVCKPGTFYRCNGEIWNHLEGHEYNGSYLSFAIHWESIQTINYLLRLKHPIDEDVWNQIRFPCKPEIFEMIFSHYDLSTASVESKSYIVSIALGTDNAFILDILLKSGITISEEDFDDDTIVIGSYDIIQRLIEIGISIECLRKCRLYRIFDTDNLFAYLSSIDYFDTNSLAYLFNAVRNHNEEAIDYLFSKSTDYNHDGIITAIQVMELDQIHLIEKFIKIGVNFENEQILCTAMHHMCYWSLSEKVCREEWHRIYLLMLSYKPELIRSIYTLIIAKRTTWPIELLLTDFPEVDFTVPITLEKAYELGFSTHDSIDELTLLEVIIFYNKISEIDQVLDTLFARGVNISHEILASHFDRCFENLINRYDYDLMIHRLRYLQTKIDFKYEHECLPYLEKAFGSTES